MYKFTRKYLVFRIPGRRNIFPSIGLETGYHDVVEGREKRRVTHPESQTQ